MNMNVTLDKFHSIRRVHLVPRQEVKALKLPVVSWPNVVFPANKQHLVHKQQIRHELLNVSADSSAT